MMNLALLEHDEQLEVEHCAHALLRPRLELRLRLAHLTSALGRAPTTFETMASSSATRRFRYDVSSASSDI